MYIKKADRLFILKQLKERQLVISSEKENEKINKIINDIEEEIKEEIRIKTDTLKELINEYKKIKS